MNNKFKNLILFCIFILILFISTFTNQFSTTSIWSQSNDISAEFSGLLFKNPTDVSNLTIERSVVKDKKESLIKYNIEFLHQGNDSNLRILGSPVRQVFFNDNIIPSHSEVTLKGDYDKVNEKLFNEKLSLRDSYKKTEDYEFKSNSYIRVPLQEEESTYSFTLYYKPRDLIYNQDKKVASSSVFITNAKVDKFTNSQKMGENENPTFNEGGFYVNAQELKDNSAISKISLLNNITSILFIISLVGVLAIIWLDKKSLSKLYIPLFMVIILTFYRFLGIGASTLAILIILPIISYLGACIARLMEKTTLILTKKELKQNLAYTILFFLLLLIIVVIPRAI
ncbi:MAG: hypothetical protein ACTHWZ_06400 [Peptoniphilaceae bacterium]